MILNIRGTSGSGKTHVVRQLVNHFQGEEITDEKGRIFGYRLPHNLWVLGRYDDAIKGGGVDNITGALHERFLAAGNRGNTMEAVEAQVRKWDELGHHVLFEGLIVTSIWGRWVNMARELPTLFLFLDTPLEVCYERVLKRSGGRTPKGYGTGESSLELEHAGTKSQILSFLQDFGDSRRIVWATGLDFKILDHRSPFDELLKIVEEL